MNIRIAKPNWQIPLVYGLTVPDLFFLIFTQIKITIKKQAEGMVQVIIYPAG